ncbi:MAG: response regulator [Pseudomonadota bacterium]|nr:response regulator [Pseudomonadota bacterium]
MRLERGFSLSDVQKAFAIFRIIMINRLPLVFQGEDLSNALLSVNNSVDVTINRFSEYFQGGTAMAKRVEIVIVDDNLELLESLDLYFREKGYAVATADNGEAGLDLIKARKPEVAIVDLRLPGLLRRPIAILPKWLKRESFVRTSIFGSRFSR